jgi:hypothetical protein
VATSGTATVNLDVAELVDEAFERAGIEQRSGYDLRTARRSMNLMFMEWANRGLNLWTIDSSTVAMVAGTATYNLPTDTVDLLDCVMRTNSGDVSNQTDLAMSRISFTSYSQIPNKLSQGFPLQFYVRRLTTTPTLTVWPVPDDAQTYTFVYWRMRRIEDTGTTATLNLDLPFRMMPAFVAGLAYYIAMKKPALADRAVALKQVYEEQWALAAGEDRDRASVRFTPWMGTI